MDQLIVLSLVALGIPLLGFVLVIFNQKSLGERAHLVSIPTIAFSTAISLYVAWVKIKNPALGTLQWSAEWIRFGIVPGFGPLAIHLNILFDSMTAILMVVVTGVSLLVHVFSSEYMKRDSRYARYYAFLGLFTFSMLGILLSGNLFQIYIFWELVGFSSYALIGHWYERSGPQYASKKAFITNRVGDVFFWIGILLLFAQFHTFDLRAIFGFINEGLPLSFSILGFSPETTLTIAGLLIFGGAIAKSAQFPLHIWLPDAMEGPTPVSALIHAATMVAAGVYLMARVFPLLTADAMLVVACVGAFTSFLAATIALTQRDIKRVLAYSTISQLGLMMMSIGAGAVASGIFHLVTHAAFKACLFLGAGSVIHAMHRAMHAVHDHETDAQDIHNMGGLLKKMPVTGWTYLIATLAITGLPLTAGFMSKGEILSGVLAYGNLQTGIATALPWIGFGVTMLTALYMWRQIFLVFFGIPSKPDLYAKIQESPRVMTAPLVILALLSLWICYGRNPIDPEHGWLLKKGVTTPAQVIPPQTAPTFRPKHYLSYQTEQDGFGIAVAPSIEGTQGWSVPPMPHQVALMENRHGISAIAEYYALGSAVLGFLIAWLFFSFRPGMAVSVRKAFKPLYTFSFRGWFIDDLYEFVFSDTIIFSSRVSAWVDRVVIDGLVNLAARVAVLLSRIVGWFDRYVVDGLVTLTGATIQFLGLMARSVQSGRIQTYLTWVVAAVVAIFFIAWWALAHPFTLSILP